MTVAVFKSKADAKDAMEDEFDEMLRSGFKRPRVRIVSVMYEEVEEIGG